MTDSATHDEQRHHVIQQLMRQPYGMLRSAAESYVCTPGNEATRGRDGGKGEKTPVFMWGGSVGGGVRVLRLPALETCGWMVIERVRAACSRYCGWMVIERVRLSFGWNTVLRFACQRIRDGGWVWAHTSFYSTSQTMASHTSSVGVTGCNAVFDAHVHVVRVTTRQQLTKKSAHLEQQRVVSRQLSKRLDVRANLNSCHSKSFSVLSHLTATALKAALLALMVMPPAQGPSHEWCSKISLPERSCCTHKARTGGPAR